MNVNECPNCRRIRPAGAARCGHCGAESPGQGLREYRLVPVDSPEPEAPPRSRRLLAAAIDAALIGGLIWAATLLKLSPATVLVRRSLWIVLPSVLILFRDAAQGRSPGKVIMGLVVVRRERGRGRSIRASGPSGPPRSRRGSSWRSTWGRIRSRNIACIRSSGMAGGWGFADGGGRNVARPPAGCPPPAMGSGCRRRRGQDSLPDRAASPPSAGSLPLEDPNS